MLIPNTSPVTGAAPYNGLFALFGQFFDHGLDLVGKDPASFVAVPVSDPTDNLYAYRSMPMLLNRTVFGSGDPASTAGLNRTTPWVDQNQTYASIASKQVFLREYKLDASGHPVATGRLITDHNLGADGKFGTTPWLMLAGMFFGLAAGLFQFLRTVNAVSRREAEEKSRHEH